MWGKVDVEINANGKTVDLSYRFIVDKVVQEFRKFGVVKPEAHGHTELG